MTQSERVLAILDRTLGLHGRSAAFKASTPLLGALPELDSMAIVALLTALEEAFDILFEDDEIDGSAFATVGALVTFVERKLAA